MTISQGEEKLRPFIEQARKDDDPFLLVHFSIVEDRFYTHQKIDNGDALLIIRNLVNGFNLNPDALCEFLK
jgi:hypothetical protein